MEYDNLIHDISTWHKSSLRGTNHCLSYLIQPVGANFCENLETDIKNTNWPVSHPMSLEVV